MPDFSHDCPRGLYLDCLLGVYNAYEAGAIVAGQAAGFSETVEDLKPGDYKNIIGGVALDLLYNVVGAVDEVPCAPACPIVIGILRLENLGDKP